MKYKKGDRVRIVSNRTKVNFNENIDKYLGMVMTIKDIRKTFVFETSFYCEMVEDKGKLDWYDPMIAGLASETPFDFGA